MTARPAAGPLTPSGDLETSPTTMPPTMPASSPPMGGAPEARAIPRQSGSATRKTTNAAGRSLLKLRNGERDKSLSSRFFMLDGQFFGGAVSPARPFVL